MFDVTCVGLAVYDQVFIVPDLSFRFGKQFAVQLYDSVGGPAAVAAQTVARLGGRTALVSRVGRDLQGEFIRNRMQQSTVDISQLREIPDSRTPTSAVFVNQRGDREIVNHSDLKGAPIDELVLPTTRVLLADSRWVPAASKLMEQAREEQKKVVMDLDSSPNPKELRNLVDLATFVVASRSGLTEYLGNENLRWGIQQMASQGKWVAVTDGVKPILWCDGTEVSMVETFPAEVVSTLGAGDVLHGAFAWSLAQGKPAVEALRFGAATASFYCSNPEPDKFPNRLQVEHILNSKSSPQAPR